MRLDGAAVQTVGLELLRLFQRAFAVGKVINSGALIQETTNSFTLRGSGAFRYGNESDELSLLNNREEIETA